MYYGTFTDTVCMSDCSSTSLTLPGQLQHVQLKARYTTVIANLVMERVRCQIQAALTSVNLGVPVHLTWWCTKAGAFLNSCALKRSHRRVSVALAVELF